MPTGQKILVAFVLALVTLWGGSKESGQRSARLVDQVATARLRTGGTVALRALPDGLAEDTNALKVTAFALNPQNHELAFEVAWTSNLFDGADSRNLHLFSATNFNARQWTPLGTFAMPSDTNECAFAVTSNEVETAWRPWFLASFAHAGFYRLGLDFDSDGDDLADVHERYWTLTDPKNADTDGDDLTDGEELSASLETDPLLYDTDGDGVGDGDEVAAGANPRVLDTDGDGLTDALEIGTMMSFTGEDFLWFDLSDSETQLITSATVGWNSWELPLTDGCEIDNICYTNIKVQVDGTVHLLCPTKATNWATPCFYGNLATFRYSDSHITVALCGADLYAKTNGWESQILYGVVERGGRNFTFVEYRNMGLYDYRDTNETMTCQLILPHDETNAVYVSYLCASNLFREVNLVVGVQRGALKSWKSGEQCYNLVWPMSADFPQNGMTIRYQIGTGTNPVVADTDGDGLFDAVEVLTTHTDPLSVDTDGDGLDDADESEIGTDPLRTDTDGDDLPDGWEYRSGANPLLDDSASDSDGDGLDTAQEYAFSTSPVMADTDGDGLSDDVEILTAHTDPLVADTDGDGLIDADEVKIGTDPCLADTDLDGLPDLWEHENGLNPVSAVGADGADGDPDGDGVLNLVERQKSTDVKAWMNVNALWGSPNACAIEKGVRYVYFKKSRNGWFIKEKSVPKENW